MPYFLRLVRKSGAHVDGPPVEGPTPAFGDELLMQLDEADVHFVVSEIVLDRAGAQVLDCVIARER
jgi:hypothetical protein